MNREVPNMTLDERGNVAQAIWVTDFRKDQGDRFATYSFPGFDPMAFSLATVDLWIQQGHPSEPKVFQDIVTPAKSTTVNGEIKFDGGCHADQWFLQMGRDGESAAARGFLARCRARAEGTADVHRDGALQRAFRDPRGGRLHRLHAPLREQPAALGDR